MKHVFAPPFVSLFLFNNRAKKAICALFAIIAATIFASCGTTQLDSQWASPEFTGSKLQGKVFIVGISNDDIVRRLYEDEMAAQLQARGLGTMRSYDVIAVPLDRNGSDGVLRAARENSANMILSSAVIGREQVKNIVSEPIQGLGYDNGFGGWYSYYWPFYANSSSIRTEVSQYNRYTIRTSLTNTATGKIMWSVRTQTDDVQSLNREVKAFVKVIIDAMTKNAVL